MNNFVERDAIATKHLGRHIGHTAAGLVRVELRKVFDGYLYWNFDSMLFIADERLFTTGNLLKLEFVNLGVPRSKYLLWNGELDFGNGEVIFHGQKKHMKQLESVIRETLKS